MIHALLTRRHDYTIGKYLASRGQALVGTLTAMPYDEVFRRRLLPAGAYILSDFERLGPTALGRVARIADALEASAAARLLNHPARCLGRHDLLRRLHDDGTNPYAAYRLGDVPPHVRFPVFLRMASDHQGPRSALLHEHAEIDAAVRGLARRGKRRSDMLVIEFQETVDGRGQYRKYGAFCVGGRIVPRHLFFGRQWDRKAPANCEDAQFDEEEAYVRDNPHEEALRRVFAVAGVDYGRIDYALDGDRLCVWEINTNPMISIPEDMTTGRPGAIHTLFHERFRDALLALDTPRVGQVDLRPTRRSLLDRLRGR